MEDGPVRMSQATQPATQLVVDPRRLGHHNSGLNDDDLTDVFCILHPASMPACVATAQIAEETPEHTISTTATTGIEMRLRDVHNKPLKAPTTNDLAAKGLVSRDLALRLSANVKDPLMGFRFGRNRQRCDFMIGNNDTAKKISNVHFRIYINTNSVVMLEDSSTNGTFVEKVMLKAKEKENGTPYRYQLQQGSLITILMTPPEEDIRFIVRIPQLEGAYGDIFHNNLQDYFNRLGHYWEKRQAQITAAVNEVNAAGPPDLFAPEPVKQRGTSPLNVEISRRVKAWNGGSKYNKVSEIGKGAFAVVYLITAKFDGTCYAAKELEKRRFMKNGIVDQKVDMEMRIMRRIRHPHIVQYIEHVDWEDKLYLIMEYVPAGDLGKLIEEKGKLPEVAVQTMTVQLLSALKYLHHMGVTHRDIKPDNILIQNHNPFLVKLTDFGLSKQTELEDETFLRTFCGTLLYCAPEVYTEYREYDRGGNRVNRGKDRKSLPQPRYSHAVDVWSLGVVLFLALCGRPPYPAESGTSYHELLNTIMSTPLDIRPLQRVGVSEAGIRFVRSLLQVHPENRPTIDELESNVWLTGDNAMMPDDEDDEDDEVDMIRDPDSQHIEACESQMRILEVGTKAINDGDGGDDDLLHTFREKIGGDFRNSFKSNGSVSSESFAFMPNRPGGARLFGEINASAIGSSGVIPVEQLNLPISDPISESDTDANYSITSTRSQSRQQEESLAMEDIFPAQFPSAQLPHYTQLPPTQAATNLSGLGARPQGRSIFSTRPPTDTQVPSTQLPINATGFGPPTQDQFDDSASKSNPISSPSLLGAESMIGQLVMDQPSTNAINSHLGIARSDIEPSASTSLRRPREEDTSSAEDIQLNAKRFRSNRETDIFVSKQVWWDIRDKSTWHYDYPDIKLSKYREAMEEAQERGETFAPGEKVFEKYVGSYRKTPSVEPELVRAHSEPTADNGRKMMMKRDERKLEDVQDAQLPSTTQNSTSTLHNTDLAQVSGRLAQPEVLPSPTKDMAFKPPKRILAKFTTLPDSALHGITLKITETLTSWGRGHGNTVVYLHGHEDRIPKYAFKLLLWKQGLPVTEDQSPHEDQSFWISTKAGNGILVNGVKVRSHEYKKPDEPAKEWGELRHGDEVTLWSKDNHANICFKMRFECYFGASRTPRTNGSPPFSVLPLGEVSEELDRFCIHREAAWRAENRKAKARREEENLKEKQDENRKKEQGGTEHKGTMTNGDRAQPPRSSSH